jgi:hypothetical protein
MSGPGPAPGAVVVTGFSSSGTGTVFRDGSQRCVAHLGATWLGQGTYLPGWQWSEHVQPISGNPSEAHAGYIVSGEMVVRGADGTERVARAGEAFYAPPGHDAWVLGDEPCVALDFPVT